MILDRILEHKKAEIRHKNSRGYLAELKTKKSVTQGRRSDSPSRSMRAARRPGRP